jgi:hypothetical protein
MPTLDDAPTISPIAAADLAGADLVQVFSDALRKPKTATITSLISANSRLTGYGGIQSADLTAAAAGTATIATRVYFINSGTTSTLTLPTASGTLREVLVINGGSGTAAISTLATGHLAAQSNIATATSARFLSNGTSWYRVS